ncbi:hypothetical protein A2U01_0104321, partial [Trifolium medium]|nr:hypothetical protein [Trifolium medium]
MISANSNSNSNGGGVDENGDKVK